MIYKGIAVILLSLTLFTGCGPKSYVYVKDACPSIQIIKTVPKMSGKVDTNGCICGDQLGILLNGASQLRKSETYYGTSIDRYNKEFAIPKEAIDKE